MSFSGHLSSIKSISVCPDNTDIFISGSRDGTLMVWDARAKRKINFGVAPINIIRQCHTAQRGRSTAASSSLTNHASQLATSKKATDLNSSTDVYTSRRPGPLTRASAPFINSSLSIAQQENCECGQSVTAVYFHERNYCMSGGAADSTIKVWDLRRTFSFLKQEPIHCHQFPYPGVAHRQYGYTSFCSDPWRSSLFACCTDNSIYQFSLTSFNAQPMGRFMGAKLKSFYIHIATSPDGEYLLGGSMEGVPYIWKVRQPGLPKYQLDGGHTDEVGCVDWSGDFGRLASCSDDLSFRLWKFQPYADERFPSRVGHNVKNPHVGIARACAQPPQTRSHTTGCSGGITPAKTALMPLFTSPKRSTVAVANDTTPILSPMRDYPSTSSGFLAATPLSNAHKPDCALSGVKDRASMAVKVLVLSPAVNSISKSTPQHREQQPTAVRTLAVASSHSSSPSKRTPTRRSLRFQDAIVAGGATTVSSAPALRDLVPLDPISLPSRCNARLTGGSDANADCSRKFWSPTANLPNLVVDRLREEQEGGRLTRLQSKRLLATEAGGEQKGEDRRDACLAMRDEVLKEPARKRRCTLLDYNFSKSQRM